MTYQEACNKYGELNVRKARHLADSEGSSSIALSYLPTREDGKDFTTRQVDAMILSTGGPTA
jgi:hypothetical protein